MNNTIPVNQAKIGTTFNYFNKTYRVTHIRKSRRYAGFYAVQCVLTTPDSDGNLYTKEINFKNTEFMELCDAP